MFVPWVPSREATSGEPPTLTGERCTLVPVAPAHVAELQRIRRTPEVEARWGHEELTPPWPFEDATVPFAVLVEGAMRGLVQYHEDPEPEYHSAGIDIFLDPAVHGRGIGRDAVGRLVRHLIEERGHHRLTIDPAVDNEPAIRSYAAVGFRPVGVMRRYERDLDGGGYHDGLLMDLLAEDLPAGDDDGTGTGRPT